MAYQTQTTKRVIGTHTTASGGTNFIDVSVAILSDFDLFRGVAIAFRFSWTHTFRFESFLRRHVKMIEVVTH